MSTHYSDPSRESDPHALPDVWVAELTPEQIERILRQAPVGSNAWLLAKQQKDRLANLRPKHYTTARDIARYSLGANNR